MSDYLPNGLEISQTNNIVTLIEVSANTYQAQTVWLYTPPTGVYLLKFPTTNTGPVTLAFAGQVGNHPVQADGADLVSGAISTDQVYVAEWTGTSFQLSGVENGAGVPICTPLPYVGTVAPEGFVFLRGETLGSAASGAVNADDGYMEAYDLIKAFSPNSGIEDWAANETVLLPDMRGRFPLGLDEAAVNRVESASAKLLGGTAGVDEISILQGNLPAVNLTANSAGNHTHNVRWPGSNLGNWNIFNYSLSNTQWATGRIQSAGAHTHTVSLGGSNIPIFTVPPFTTFNWIMRAK